MISGDGGLDRRGHGARRGAAARRAARRARRLRRARLGRRRGRPHRRDRHPRCRLSRAARGRRAAPTRRRGQLTPASPTASRARARRWCCCRSSSRPRNGRRSIPRLARHFTVITLGGRHLGGVAALEDRARAPTYRAMFRTLIDLMAPAARRGDPRCRLRLRRARPAARRAARRRQPDHRDRRQPIPVARGRGTRRRGRTGRADPLRAGQCRDPAVRRCIVRLRLLRHRAGGMRRRPRDRRDDPRGAARRTDRRHRARDRPAAMVEPRAARRPAREGGDAAAIGRARAAWPTPACTAACAGRASRPDLLSRSW